MSKSIINNTTATVANDIENLLLYREDSQKPIIKASYDLLARAVSVTVLPCCLFIELLFKQIPKTLASIPFTNDQKKVIKFKKNLKKVEKYCLALFFSPLSIRAPDVISTFFLKTLFSTPAVRPFGVEEQYGKTVEKIEYPANVEEVQKLILQAKAEKKKVSLIGAGMCQGPQTIPVRNKDMVINTRRLNKIEFGKDNNTVKVQAGATWEDLQIEANKRGKSVIVKQASDIFSIGGSIGINCHGWAHEYGALSSTVESLEIIDAEGKLRHLTPADEMFGCFFGTLGYFGVVVSATLKLVDNEYLIERTEEVEIDDFVKNYEEKIKGKDIPLFGGRLVLYDKHGNPLNKVCMNRYERDIEANKAHQTKGIKTPHFTQEPDQGTRPERFALQAISHLSNLTVFQAITLFWKMERKNMLKGQKLTRNEALHPPIKAFMMLHDSKLHAQWLQEYFIKKENLPNFLRYLGKQLKDNKVRLINATIRPTPKDNISILPYAEQDRYGVVICFDQLKSKTAMEHTRQWCEEVNRYLIAKGDVYYQAYMPYTTQEQFEQCYGQERVQKLRQLKEKYDPQHLFGNEHTAKYFDKK